MIKPAQTRRAHTGGVMALGTAALAALALSLSPTGPAASSPKPNRYIGVGKCMNCHSSTDGGDQYAVWKKSKHASAFALLGTDEAKQVGEKLGVGDPQKSDECLQCHVTGHGKPAEAFKRGFDLTQGVQCENCHGPGEQHMRARFRATAMADPVPEGQVPPYVEIPDDEIVKAPARQVCFGCHNSKSPSFKPFCYYERVAKIRHLDPRKPRTKEERAAMLVCGCDTPCPCVDESSADSCGVPPKE